MPNKDIVAISESIKAIEIQPRDLEFLRLLLHTRILTLKHASVFVFGGSREAAKKRVQKLKANGLVLERRRKAYDLGVLFLSKKGFQCLQENGEVPDDFGNIRSFSKRAAISELTLRHELEVLDVRLAFFEATAKQPNLSIEEFSTWPRLYEFSVNDREKSSGVKTVKPDGFIRLHEKDVDEGKWEHMFFLEVDRSTEKLAILVERARHYNLFYRSGGMSERFGHSKESYKEFPFRVLIVCKSKERMDNLAFELLQMKPPLLTQISFSTMKKVCGDSLGKVWLVPGDYQQSKIINIDSMRYLLE